MVEQISTIGVVGILGALLLAFVIIIYLAAKESKNMAKKNLKGDRKLREMFK